MAVQINYPAKAVTKPLALILDDEEHARESLAEMIQELGNELSTPLKASSAEEAYQILDDHRIDFIFLDIQMPGINGFDFLHSIRERRLPVIFVTAHSQYALRALKCSAVDYLLKPVVHNELREAIHKVLLSIQQGALLLDEHYDALKFNLNHQEDPSKIILNHAKGFKVVDMVDICYIVGDRNYSRFHFMDGSDFLSSKNLSYFEDFINDVFVRIHKSHIINIHHLKEYTFKEVGYALMADGQKLEISRRRLKSFLNRLKRWSK